MYSIAEIVKYFQPGKSVGFCSEEAFGRAMSPADGRLSWIFPSIKRGLRGVFLPLFPSVIAAQMGH